MPKNRCQIPRPYGAGIAGSSGLVVVVSDGFSFGCEIVAVGPLPGADGQCFTARDQYGFMDTLFRVLVGFLL